jgi:hypothetical protein
MWKNAGTVIMADDVRVGFPTTLDQHRVWARARIDFGKQVSCFAVVAGK